MGIRSRGLATAVAALLLASLPAYAQDESSTVSFDGFGFTFDEALGASVNIMQVPSKPPEAFMLSFPSPDHLAFTIYGPRSEGAKVPRANRAAGVVRFYPTADLADYAWPSQQLADLQSLLDARPDLAVYTAADDVDGAQSLPFVLDGSAGQANQARAHYVDTPDLAGVAYLTVFRQAIYPFAAGDFWYTFQGLSSDGSWYVAADFAVEAGMFPAKVGLKQAKRTSTIGKWTAYQEQSLQTLDGAAPDAFTPPLTSIDALVGSITFGSGPAT
jgi:hypothetical protein